MKEQAKVLEIFNKDVTMTYRKQEIYREQFNLITKLSIFKLYRELIIQSCSFHSKEKLLITLMQTS